VYQSITGTTRRAAKPDVTVCLIVSDDRQLHRQDRVLDQQAGGVLSAARKRAECTGEVGEVTPVYADRNRRYLLLGLGESSKLDAGKVRTAAAGLVAVLDKMAVRRVHLSVPREGIAGLDAAALARALGDGMGLGALVFEDFKGTTAKKSKVTRLTVSTSHAATAHDIQQSLALSESANFARRLAATPPNIATTTRVAAEARRLARASRGLSCSVIKGKGLEKNRLVGLLNVGKASKNPPCLIQLTYTPRGRTAGCVLLIGKTICYDTGGLNLKINNTMKGMKYDKSGGAAVLGAMHAVARLRPRCRVVALLPTAENSISDEAQRPDDILTYPNGVTVEVTSTDAEGRLVLADALAYGCRKIKPDAIIDVATLTGGVIVALGRACAGLWCEDDALRARIESAAQIAGERVWRMPLFDDYKEMMKSKHADLWNLAPVRDAHPIQGAAFLSYFVDPKIPWAHIDIAGVADVDKDQPPFVVGPTGFGVRLLAMLLQQWK